MGNTIQPFTSSFVQPLWTGTDYYTTEFSCLHLQEKTIWVLPWWQPGAGAVLFAQVEIARQSGDTYWAAVGAPSNFVATVLGIDTTAVFTINWTLHSAFCRVHLWIPVNGIWSVSTSFSGKG